MRRAKNVVVALLILQAAVLALEVYLVAETGNSIAVAGTVFVAVMLAISFTSWRSIP